MGENKKRRGIQHCAPKKVKEFQKKRRGFDYQKEGREPLFMKKYGFKEATARILKGEGKGKGSIL